jgi:hypothetical protein
MLLKINKGSHRPTNWMAWLRLWYNKKVIRREFLFHPNCEYNLGNDNQDDHNKLFGIGYFWDKRDSARIGWRWSVKRKKYIISAYAHVDGKIVFEDICEVVSNQKCYAVLRILTGFYQFEVFSVNGYSNVGTTSINYTHKKKFSYGLGLFFGGNETSPQKMKVEMSGI